MTPARAAQAAALVYALIVPLTNAAVEPAAAAAPVTMWLTTADQANLLAPQPPSAVSAGDQALPTIAVDPTRTFQPIDGFGASITESAAHVIGTSPNRDAVMRALFDRSSRPARPTSTSPGSPSTGTARRSFPCCARRSSSTRT
jgi:glucosylceramidase